MEFSAVLFCLFFLVIGLMAIGAVKRTYVVQSKPVDLQRLRQQQAVMEARRAQRERSQNWFKLDDESPARKRLFDEPHGADSVTPTPSPEAVDGKQTGTPDNFTVTRVDEAFKTFLRGRP